MPLSEIPRPEPVLDEASIAAKVSALATALATIAAVVGVLSLDDVSNLVAAIVAVVGTIVALVNYVAPLWRAGFARAKVTPLVDPVDNTGTPLVLVA